jgi:hypothetical protein
MSRTNYINATFTQLYESQKLIDDLNKVLNDYTHVTTGLPELIKPILSEHEILIKAEYDRKNKNVEI